MERVREVLDVLHQLVGVPDVRQAEPEHGPQPVHKAAVTMFEVPGGTETGGGAGGVRVMLEPDIKGTEVHVQ